MSRLSMCGFVTAKNPFSLAKAHTVVQLHLCVVCNKDIKIKYQFYQKSGATEYWLVFPHEQTLHQFVLDENGCYQLKAMHVDQVSSHLFPELLLDLNEEFESVGDD